MDKLFRGRKKGTLGEPLVDFWSYIVFLVMVIIFLFLFNFNKEEAEIAIGSKVGDLNTLDLASSYLKTPIMFQGQNTNAGELIASLEQDILALKKQGKKAGPCTFYGDDVLTKIGAYFLYDVKMKDDEKCQALLKATQILFEREDDDTSHHMTMHDGKKAIWTDITVRKIKENNKQYVDPYIVMTPESGVQLQNCVKLKLPLYGSQDGEDKNVEHIAIRFCQETGQI